MLWIAFDLPRGTGGHSNVSPSRKLNCDNGAFAVAGPCLGKGVEKGISRCVINLASRGQSRTDRRNDSEEVEWLFLKNGFDHQRASQLRIDNRRRLARILLQKRTVVEDSCGVDYTVDSSEALMALLDRTVHRLP